MGGCGPNHLNSLCHIFPNEPTSSTHPTWQGWEEGSASRWAGSGHGSSSQAAVGCRKLWLHSLFHHSLPLDVCSVQSPLGKGRDFGPSTPLPFSSEQPNRGNSDHRALPVVLHKWALAPVHPPTHSRLSRSRRGHPAARGS